MAGQLHVVHSSARLSPAAFTRDAWEAFAHARAVVGWSPAADSVAAELARQGVAVRLFNVDEGDPSDLVGELLRTSDPHESVVLLAVVSPLTTVADEATGDVIGQWRVAGCEVVEHAAPAESAGARLIDLVHVMDVLRSPGGCPWDARQTHESLLRYLVEESYEVVDAIQSGDRDHLREELGDLLLQVVFHSRIAQENADGAWTVDDVADGIVQKLVRRHPHVFARVDADSADQPLADAIDVEANWKRLKAAEKQRTGVLDGVPTAQPALLLAAALVSRSDDDALPPTPDVDTLLATMDEQALGDHLLAVAIASAGRGWEPEAALRAAVRRAAARIDQLTAAQVTSKEM